MRWRDNQQQPSSGSRSSSRKAKADAMIGKARERGPNSFDWFSLDMSANPKPFPDWLSSRTESGVSVLVDDGTSWDAMVL